MQENKPPRPCLWVRTLHQVNISNVRAEACTYGDSTCYAMQIVVGTHHVIAITSLQAK